MFIVSCIKPIGPKVVPLAVCTHNVCFIIFTLSGILVNSWYEMQEKVSPVSKRAIIGSQFEVCPSHLIILIWHIPDLILYVYFDKHFLLVIQFCLFYLNYYPLM